MTHADELDVRVRATRAPDLSAVIRAPSAGAGAHVPVMFDGEPAAMHPNASAPRPHRPRS
jgi:hypothetical protein